MVKLMMKNKSYNYILQSISFQNHNYIKAEQYMFSFIKMEVLLMFNFVKVVTFYIMHIKIL